MRITLSAAITADGYLDDNTSERLVISTPGDWQEVYALRGQHDAILVGAETLRRDNPTLRLRDEALRRQRQAAGLCPDITKVSVSHTSNLDPSLRFFTVGEATRYLFTNYENPALQGLMEQIVTPEPITAAYIVTELEKRGVEHLFVEGGAQILQLFLQAGLADTLRLAINPSLSLGAEKGGAKFPCSMLENWPYTERWVDGMRILTYTFHADTSAEDLPLLHEAIAQSRHCVPSQGCYRVGAVLLTQQGERFTGYTHETSPTHHAEQEAIKKALQAGASLRGATMYASMEPCSQRKSEPESCSQLLIKHGFARVAFALYEPDCFVCCQGAQRLREAGIETRHYPSLGEEVLTSNAHLWKK